MESLSTELVLYQPSQPHTFLINILRGGDNSKTPKATNMSKQHIARFVQRHRVFEMFAGFTQELLKERPENVRAFLVSHLTGMPYEEVEKEEPEPLFKKREIVRSVSPTGKFPAPKLHVLEPLQPSTAAISWQSPEHKAEQMRARSPPRNVSAYASPLASSKVMVGTPELHRPQTAPPTEATEKEKGKETEDILSPLGEGENSGVASVRLDEESGEVDFDVSDIAEEDSVALMAQSLDEAERAGELVDVDDDNGSESDSYGQDSALDPVGPTGSAAPPADQGSISSSSPISQPDSKSQSQLSVEAGDDEAQSSLAVSADVTALGAPQIGDGPSEVDVSFSDSINTTSSPQRDLGSTQSSGGVGGGDYSLKLDDITQDEGMDDTLEVPALSDMLLRDDGLYVFEDEGVVHCMRFFVESGLVVSAVSDEPVESIMSWLDLPPNMSQEAAEFHTFEVVSADHLVFAVLHVFPPESVEDPTWDGAPIPNPWEYPAADPAVNDGEPFFHPGKTEVFNTLVEENGDVLTVEWSIHDMVIRDGTSWRGSDSDVNAEAADRRLYRFVPYPSEA